MLTPIVALKPDLLVTQAMESLHRSGDRTVQALVKGAGDQLEIELRKVATGSILAATTTLRDSIERDVNPATQRLARQMAAPLDERSGTSTRARSAGMASSRSA